MYRTLVAFDLDDTLFWYKDEEDTDHWYPAKIDVIHEGYVKRIDRFEYYTYELKEGESFWYGEFENADRFRFSARPVKLMVDSIKQIVDNDYHGYEAAIVTARGNFTDMEAFKDVLREHGIDPDKIKLVMCGEYHAEFKNSPERKVHGFKQMFGKEPPDSVIFFDDQPNNLRAFLGMTEDYPGIKLDARLVYVDDRGNAKVSLFK